MDVYRATWKNLSFWQKLNTNKISNNFNSGDIFFKISDRFYSVTYNRGDRKGEVRYKTIKCYHTELNRIVYVHAYNPFQDDLCIAEKYAIKI